MSLQPVQTAVRFAPVTGTKDPVPEPSLRAERPYRLALVVKNTTNPAWLAARRAADTAAQRYGVQVEHFAPRQPDDADEQTAILETIIAAARFDGLLLAPADFRAQVPVVERANRASLPIYNLGNRIAGGEVVTYVGSDDFAIGRQMIDWLARHLHGQARLLIIEGIRSAITGQNRIRGIQAALQQHPGLQVLAAEPADYDRERARRLTADLLQAHPSANALLALNDEMALGAIAALETAGRLPQVTVVGCNGTADGLRAMQQGKLAASVDYSAYDLAAKSMELAVRHLNGERLPEQDLELPAPMIDAANLDQVVARRRSWGLL